MARKKHALEGDDYSSSDDEQRDRGVTRRDLEDEIERFRGPAHKQRKRTKEESTYGVFYDWGSEDEGSSSRPGERRSTTRRRQGLSFVAAGSKKKQESLALDQDEPSDEDMNSASDSESHQDRSDDGADSRDDMDMVRDGEDEDEDEDEDEREARARAFQEQRQRDQEALDAYEDRTQKPRMGANLGIGLGSSTSPPEHDSAADSPSSSSNTPTRNKAAAASIRAGLGLSANAGTSTPTDGSPRNQQRNRGNHGSMSFFKNRANFGEAGSIPGSPSPNPSSPASTSSPRRDVPMIAPVEVNKSYGEFSSKGSGFGIKMLEKMGWKKGYGLGTGGTGIVEPIQTKLRPVKMGIGYKGFKEKTDQDRAEERRRGVAVSSDEDDKPSKKTPKKSDKKEQAPKVDGWKKSSQGSRKGPKIEYKTAEEIQQEIESGDLPMAPVQSQKILDMTGKTVRELSSASQIRSSAPFEHERFPELRHNLQLMADISTTDLEHLVRSHKADNVRLKVLETEGERMQKLVAQDEMNIERMVKVLSITDSCSQIADEIRTTTGALSAEIKEDYLVKSFQEPFDLFSSLYFEEYQLCQLDQVFVAAIQDGFKTLLRDWDVLKNPTLGAGLFQTWKKLLRTSKVIYSNSGMAAALFGRKAPEPEQMTAYESLLNAHWLPKVRSALNNEWNPRECDPVIKLLEAWASPLLPAFMRDNIITQLILPKLKREVEQWSPRDSLMLHTWIHPWLPVLEESLLDQELYGDVRRKLALGLSAWNVLDPSALRVLEPWKGVLSDEDMEMLLQKSVLPRLVEGLQMLEINPRDQKIEIFQSVLPWYDFFPAATFSSLFVNEFFPKWHQVLQLWLSHPSTTDLDQVFQWYQWWKTRFPAALAQDPGIATGFRQGLDMINQGLG
ncbi:GC-rich sequence DNA-binding factor-like protein-domain-containing protein [Mortierella sp. GBAus27b]|nr:hypothetical protein BGX31_004101 [Mortierella sp. GBA43]KAI8347892.1 GC-rich sequence DNA-binding factor-like protein-domain-containing protein [Mortierella sp. GBAus27b]